jgi:hypothetical protein
MGRIPFSVYDFFGYLASGFLFLVSVDYFVGKQWILDKEFSITLSLVGVVLAYVIGHIIANPSAWLLERIVVGKYLRYPSKNLLRKRPRVRSAKLFPGYYTPLPPIIRNKILKKARADGVSGS